MNPKIHIFTPIRYPVGGIRTYLKYTYGMLDRNKYKFTILGTSAKWLERIKNDLSQHDVEIIQVKSEENNFSLLYSIARTLRADKYDLIHSQGYTAGMLSTVGNMFLGLPHVITLHRIFGHDQFSGIFWGKYAKLKRYLIEFFLKRADVVNSVSKDAQANLLEYFPGLIQKASKLKVIRNGIKIGDFVNQQYPDVRPFTRQAGEFYIGYFGRYMPEKGFTHLIDTMEILVNQKQIKNIQIVSVGGFGEYIREYQKEIKKRELHDFFQFLDFFENIAPVLKKIDLLIIPSLSEACPLIPMEGLICGTPVLAYSCPGLREILEDTPARMVAVGDRRGLADAIIDIMGDYKNIKKTCDAFISEAINRFDSTHTASQLEGLFHLLVEKHNIDNK